jgi:hypothetical protein
MYRNKIREISSRESSKVSDVKEPAITEEKKQLLVDALEYMCSVCDGAKTKDEIGFSKPDAHIATWFNSASLLDAEEDVYRTLERILVRYKRQLSGFGIWD